MSGVIKTNPLYVKQIGVLCKMLEENHISFEVGFDSFAKGFIVIFPSSKERTGDVILHDHSYGNCYGGFEGYGKMSTVEGDVCVFDTIGEVVLQAIKAGYQKAE